MSNIQIINIKTSSIKDYVFCGRGSFLGNPFHIDSSNNRKKVINMYKLWFYDQLKDKNVLNALKSIVEKHNKDGIVYLGCYCYPLDCHCEVIKKYLIDAYFS